MTLIRTKNKYVIILIAVFVGTIYLMGYISSIKAKIYHKEFKNETFDKLNIEIVNNFTDEKVEINILEKNELEFHYELFASQLEYDAHIKERKLYDYSVYLKFYNTKYKNLCVFKVFFDNKKAVYRPVYLKEKDKREEFGGYSFALKDEGFEFYKKIIKIWKTSEKSTL
jgi:hypothetical protein